MIWDFILFTTLIIILAIIRYSYSRYAVLEGKDMVLYTNIPHGHMKDEFIVNTLKSLKKKHNILFAISVLLSFLMFVDENWSILVYYNVIVFYMLIGNLIEYKSMKKIREYKNQNNLSTKKSITIYDLKTASNIERKKIRLIAWLVPLILQIIVMSAILKNNEMKITYIFLMVLMNLGTIITGLSINKMQVKVFSEDEEENYEINENTILKIQQTLYAIYIAFVFIGVILIYFQSKNIFNLLPIILYIILDSISICFVFLKFRKSSDYYENTRFSNGDFYDTWGYYNPNDSRLMVEDIRRPGNMTINRAKLSGKIVLAMTVVMLVFLEGLILSLGFPKTYKFEDNFNTISISQSIYKTKIDKSDIESVEFIDDMREKELIRNNGAGLKKNSYGKFIIKGIGNVDLYVYNDNPKAIWIKTKTGKNLVFNFKTEKETTTYYNAIKK